MSAWQAAHAAASSVGRTGRSQRNPCLTALRQERSLPASERGPVLWLDMADLGARGKERPDRTGWPTCPETRLPQARDLWGVQIRGKATTRHAPGQQEQPRSGT